MVHLIPTLGRIPAPLCPAKTQSKTFNTTRASSKYNAPPRASQLAVKAEQGGSTDGAESSQPTDAQPNLKGALENPVLHDLLFGLGSSEAPIERPSDAPEKLSQSEAMAALQMGSWRLRSLVCPQIEALVAQVEGSWRSILGNDLGLYPLDLRFKYMDSLDPAGTARMSYTFPDPPKDDPMYPRLQIENRMYQSPAFRKLHLEVAVRQDGLQVFHCVMYPNVEYDLPILSMDVVANADRISFAIIDPCPVAPDMSIPNIYKQPISDMQERYGVASNRSTPDWGKAIFSEFCVIMRPTSPEEVASFLKYAIELSLFHIQIARMASPLAPSKASSKISAIRAAHQRYCDMQLQNDKTFKVLEKAFGEELSREYMKEVMFKAPESPSSP